MNDALLLFPANSTLSSSNVNSQFSFCFVILIINKSVVHLHIITELHCTLYNYTACTLYNNKLQGCGMQDVYIGCKGSKHSGCFTLLTITSLSIQHKETSFFNLGNFRFYSFGYFCVSQMGVSVNLPVFEISSIDHKTCMTWNTRYPN